MDEELKQRVMIAFVAFNITVMIMMICLWLFGAAGEFGTFFIRLVISAVVGAVVAGVTYVGVQLAQK